MNYTVFRRINVRKSNSYSGRIPSSMVWKKSFEYDFAKKYTATPVKDQNGLKFTSQLKPIAKYEERIETGRITKDLKSKFNRRLGQYKSRYDVKVGITGQDPKKRFKQHLSKKEWYGMVVVFKTSSKDVVRDMESFLTKSIDDLLNEIRGGGGKLCKPPYYVYFLLKKNPDRKAIRI